MSAAAVQPKPPAAGKQLEWVNPPQQARSQQTLDRLLDAAEALIEERGFEEISVAEITRKARSSVGAFYSRFKDKQGLLRYVQQRFSEQAAATAEVALSPDRWAGMSVYEICHDLVEFLVRLYGERGGLLLTFHFHVRTDSEIADRLVANNERIVDMLTRLLIEHKDAIDDIENIARVEGVDACLIAPNDLSMSYGHRDGPNHPEVQQAIARAEAALLPSGIAVGGLAPDNALANQMIDKGYRLILTGYDTLLIDRGARAILDGLNR